MPSTVFGLPLHPLIVHATTVLVPLAVVTVVLAVLVPRFRRWAGPLPALLSLVALVLTPLSTESGENLERSVAETALLERHAELGDQLIPMTVALFVLAAAFWWLGRRQPQDRARTLVAVVGGLAIVAAAATGVQVARIGHSGSAAAWSDVGSASGSAE